MNSGVPVSPTDSDVDEKQTSPPNLPISTASLIILTKMILVDGSGGAMSYDHLPQLYQGLGPIGPPPAYEPEAIKFPEPLKPP